MPVPCQNCFGHALPARAEPTPLLCGEVPKPKGACSHTEPYSRAVRQVCRYREGEDGTPVHCLCWTGCTVEYALHLVGITTLFCTQDDE